MSPTPIAEGALVEIVRAIDSVPPFNRTAVVGDKAIVEDYVSAEESEDGTPFYWLDNPQDDGTTYGAMPADAVRQVMAADQMAARPLPSTTDIAHDISWLGGELFTTSACDGDTVTLYGQTDDGLNFSVQVHIGAPRKL